jgi:serine O-acetyltransferase
MSGGAAERGAGWLWRRIVAEAREQGETEPMLASFFHASVLAHSGLAPALAALLAGKLGNSDVWPMLMRQVFEEVLSQEPALVEAASADLGAHFDRDPACTRYVTPFLFFKGFHAVQTHRVAHALWRRDRHSLALFLQSRSAAVFDADIHPAAQLGGGLMVDHATGIVIGETAVVGDNVSMLHGVTLGGSGNAGGRRHPRIGEGVLIAAGARLLGPIRVGKGAKVAAGSLVLADVPAGATVAGVPARVVGRRLGTQPALDMDQGIDGAPGSR